MEASVNAYRMNELPKRTGLSRSSLFEAARDGLLVTRKFGRATVVLENDLRSFLENLPVRNAA